MSRVMLHTCKVCDRQTQHLSEHFNDSEVRIRNEARQMAHPGPTSEKQPLSVETTVSIHIYARKQTYVHAHESRGSSVGTVTRLR